MNEKFILNKYLGINFKDNGRTLNGLDCWGLFQKIYFDVGIKVPEIICEDKFFKSFIKTNNPIFLDSILFKDKEDLIYHIGIILNQNRFIHACKKSGVIVSKLSHKIWKNNVQGIYRFKK